VRPEDVRREPDQFGGEGREPVAVPFSITVGDGDVVSLHIAEITQALPKGNETACGSLLGARFQHPNEGSFLLPRLCLGDAWCREQAQGEHHNEPNGAVQGYLLESLKLTFCLPWKPNAQAEARATPPDTRAGKKPALWPVASSAVFK
jgi:hypothetical protein